MEKIKVGVQNPYWVYAGKDIMGEIPQLIDTALKTTKHRESLVFIVTDRLVSRYYLKPLAGTLRKHGFRVKYTVLQPGEKLKSHNHLYRLLRLMVRHGLTRDSIVAALGGGVIGDFSGFAASIYMRGCRFIQIPTTLLAQVDSSIGGKVGINLKEGKNLVGSFYNPLFVVSDIGVLKTLDKRQFLSGFAEVIKYGLIFNRDLFEKIEGFIMTKFGENKPQPAAEELHSHLLSDMGLLQKIILKSARIKAEIVCADERENDLRMILNFGHTFGHAVEKLTGYRRFLHGEAVFLGMDTSVRLSSAMGMIPQSDAAKIFKLLSLFRIPPVKGLAAKTIFKQIGKDKKKRGGKLHYILLNDIGNAVPETNVEKKMVLKSIEETLALHRK